MDTKSRAFLTLSLILIGLGLIFLAQVQTLGKMRLIFCDVGQGDGMLLVTPGGRQIVVDGGPGNKILDCLSAHMPFWDRTIEMILLTHPQKDHMEGLLEVMRRYKVKMIVTTGVKNDTELFKVWQEGVKAEGARVYQPRAGNIFKLDSNRGLTPNMKILWPTQSDLNVWSQSPPKDLNESSIVVRLEYGEVCAYLTGDIPKEILQGLIDKSCQVLKVSHHGSKTGTNSRILEQVRPAIAVIQVGKNSFGHPHEEVTDILTAKGAKILRNDLEETIELATDGKDLSIAN